MWGKTLPTNAGKSLARAAGSALVMFWLAGFVPAQTPDEMGHAPAPSSGIEVVPAVAPAAQETTTTEIIPASCATCGKGLFGAGFPSMGEGHSYSGCGDCCSSGHKCDCCWCPKTCVGRMVNGIYQCICCPDPCYVPEWLPVANAAFFTETVRPVTQMRLRYDAGFDVTAIDRAEYFVPQQRGTGLAGGKGPQGLITRAGYQDLMLYSEAAVGAFGAFVEMPYRYFKPDNGTPINGVPANQQTASGFGDLNIGTKTLFLDCELLQVTGQFKTYIPTGNFLAGLGTGHVSLEPSGLASLKCTNTCYLQMQTAYWIPIAGSPNFQGNVWHNHFSVNKILCKPCNDFQLIGTLELNEWTIFNGGYTDAVLAPLPGNPTNLAAVRNAAKTGILSAGPGLRTVICNNIDAGVGTAFALTQNHWANTLIRAELRWRF